VNWLALAPLLALLSAAAPPSAPPRKPGKISAQPRSAPKRPVQITADNFDLQTPAQQATWRGHVVIVRDELTVTCDSLTADYDQGRDIKKLTCRNNVHLLQKVKPPAVEREAWGALAIFDNDTAVLTLTGDKASGQPHAREGENTMRGEKVTFLVDQDKLLVEKPVSVFETKDRELPGRKGGTP
jgi:lipopolysaccharide transport protein LptA